jgi:hypothetical protein
MLSGPGSKLMQNLNYETMMSKSLEQPQTAPKRGFGGMENESSWFWLLIDPTGEGGMKRREPK